MPQVPKPQPPPGFGFPLKPLSLIIGFSAILAVAVLAASGQTIPSQASSKTVVLKAAKLRSIGGQEEMVLGYVATGPVVGSNPATLQVDIDKSLAGDLEITRLHYCKRDLISDPAIPGLLMPRDVEAWVPNLGGIFCRATVVDDANASLPGITVKPAKRLLDGVYCIHVGNIQPIIKEQPAFAAPFVVGGIAELSIAQKSATIENGNARLALTLTNSGAGEFNRGFIAVILQQVEPVTGQSVFTRRWNEDLPNVPAHGIAKYEIEDHPTSGWIPGRYYFHGIVKSFEYTSDEDNIEEFDTAQFNVNSNSMHASPAAGRKDAVENSVVKVFSTVRHPDLFRPWTKEPPSQISGSGVVIEGKRILSNAHVVNYASQVQIQANQAGNMIGATVVATEPGIDLALLKLDDETFFDTHAPLERAKTMPEIKDAVMVYGYPTGGSSLSITKGIVSRIEFAAYNFLASGLRIQIDAAVNPGNSGGPAVAGDKMIGLAFSHLANAENIGYIIPCEEIELFLQGTAAGNYQGKPAMFEHYQTLGNPALREFLELDKTVHGIIVRQPGSTDAGYPLKEWDVITKIGDTAVDEEGMIKSGNLRLNFTYLVQKTARDGKVPLTVIRDGSEMRVDLPVRPKAPMVIDALAGAYPSYFVYGPLVFSTATREFCGSVPGHEGADVDAVLALIKRAKDLQAFEGERLVVVSSPFFPHKLGRGYSNPLSEVVKSVNGIAIKNLNHLVEVLRDSHDAMITFEFDNRSGEALVFPRAEMVAATEEILTDNGVRSQGSPDTMAVWNAKK